MFSVHKHRTKSQFVQPQVSYGHAPMCTTKKKTCEVAITSIKSHMDDLRDFSFTGIEQISTDTSHTKSGDKEKLTGAHNYVYFNLTILIKILLCQIFSMLIHQIFLHFNAFYTILSRFTTRRLFSRDATFSFVL